MGTPEPTPEVLIAELQERAQWYFKRFGSTITSIRDCLETYLVGREPKETARIYVQKRIDMAQQVYETVPLDTMQNSSDYDLLSGVKEKLPELRKEIEAILEGGKDNIVHLQELVIEICELGSKFRLRLCAILDKIREFKGYEDYRFGGKDMRGMEWSSLF